MIVKKIADKIWQGYSCDYLTDEERDELFRVGYWDEYENLFASPSSYDEVYWDVLSIFVSLGLFAAFVFMLNLC